MKKIKNDFGEFDYAVGEAGSIARIKCQYPKAIARVDALFFAGSYDRMGIRSAYLDALSELNDLYSSDVVDQIMRASLFNESKNDC